MLWFLTCWPQEHGDSCDKRMATRRPCSEWVNTNRSLQHMIKVT